MKVFASIENRLTLIRGHPHSGWGGAKASDPGAKSLSFNFEITDDGAGNFLFVSYSADKAFGADSWHTTLDEAYRVAEEQFGIKRSEWTQSRAV
jgi:hypothetical protein